MKNFGENIATLINFLLLSIVYIFGVGITKIFAKLLRKNFLELKLNVKNKSYWSKLDLKKKEIEDYYRQF